MSWWMIGVIGVSIPAALALLVAAFIAGLVIGQAIADCEEE